MKCHKCNKETNYKTTTNWPQMILLSFVPIKLVIETLKINIELEKTICEECYIDNLINIKLK